MTDTSDSSERLLCSLWLFHLSSSPHPHRNMSDTTPSLPVNPTPNGNPAPAPAAAFNHADLARILGPSFEQHLGLQPNTFLPELAVLSRVVQQTNEMDAESIGKVVHKVRYERCKAAWSRGEVDVSAEVIARDLVNAAKDIEEETVSCPMKGKEKTMLIAECRSSNQLSKRGRVVPSFRRRRNPHLVRFPATLNGLR